MPNRILRDGIISSTRIGALSTGAENFYRRLMSVADDYGRYHGSVVTLRGACWPTNPERIREKELGKWLNELLRGDDPLVKTYVVDGATYLEIQSFGQQIRTKSKFPDPPWWAVANKVPAMCEQDDGKIPEESSTSRRRSRISESESKTETKAKEAPPVVLAPIQLIPAKKLTAELARPSRFHEWLDGYRGRKADPDEACRAWISVDADLSVENAFACRDRYNASREVSENVLTEASKFIFQQARNKWAGNWPLARASPLSAAERKSEQVGKGLEILDAIRGNEHAV